MAVLRAYRVPIPNRELYTITINRADKNKVLFVLSHPYNVAKGYAEPKRTVIGYVCPDDVTKMYPTDKYKEIFPSEWKKYSGEQANPMTKKIGLYTAFKAINTKCKIIELVRQSFGDEAGNSLLDFSLFSILCRTAATSQMENSISDQLLFSPKVRSDSYYSKLFKEEINDSSIIDFKKRWALQCRQSGAESVWLCIDGSNDDCNSEGVELAEKGHAKSLKNKNIVSFTYAVTNTGSPVTFNVYRGSLVDAKAMTETIDFLTECNIKLNGVILDRGYCNSRTLNYLSERDIPYIIMVKGTPMGVEEIVREYGSKIKMNAEYLIKGTNLFGVQKPCQIFKDFNHTDYLTLFFNYENAAARISTLVKQVNREIKRIDVLLRKYDCEKMTYDKEVIMLKTLDKTKSLNSSDNEKSGKDKISTRTKKLNPPLLPSIKENLREFIEIGFNEENKKHEANINTVNLQIAFNEKGLYPILSSYAMPPAEIDSLYTSRTSSEVQYRIIKTELGYGQIRIHFTSSLYAKFTVGFISSIIRYHMQSYARSIYKNTSDIIREMNLLSAIKINDTYTYSHLENERQINFLKFFGCDISLFDQVVTKENQRLAGNFSSPRRRKPGPKSATKNEQSHANLQRFERTSHTTVEQDLQNNLQQNVVDKGVIHSLPNENLSIQNEQTPVTPVATVVKKKRGVKPGTKRTEFNKDGTPRKKPGVPAGTKRSKFRNNGELRRKPGPKPSAEQIESV